MNKELLYIIFGCFGFFLLLIAHEIGYQECLNDIKENENEEI